MTIQQLRERNAEAIFNLIIEAGLPVQFQSHINQVALRRRGGSRADVQRAGLRHEEVIDALDWADKHFEQALKIAGLK